ncbi:putative E3 ubiquitin ligase complex SCF subunit sconB [Erysiphe necator]|uniref:Putative sulfur metabolite repression control protein n=1 Tax=Uncinula necator TaxID=52586 RepID=A0A0B1P5X9_UNCNE|nr:putative E3 ubiquitin ligase complex SCF subunit sconB [Erysiphe necator]KHJ32089.1 putative sulfur metabolite repression control protein [Erysiphe necator]
MKAKQSVDNVRHFGIEFKGQYEARQGKGVHEIVRDLNDSTLKSSFDTNNVDQILVDSLNTKQLLSQSVVESHAQSSRDSPKDSNTMYCYRHRPDSMCRRTADEPTMEALSKKVKILPASEQDPIYQVWSLFSKAPAKHRNLMLQGILSQCCFPQLSYLSTTVRDLIRIDFISALPCEIAIKILCFLDTKSLCKSAQVSRKWRKLADDDMVWQRMCEQHIDRKCTQCGWGLPLLERKRLRDWKRQQQLRAIGDKRNLKPHGSLPVPHEEVPETLKSQKTSSKRISLESTSDQIINQFEANKRQRTRAFKPEFRPWKDVYKDRFQIGSNWKYGRCSTKVFKGHSNGVMCLQLEDNILATGSYDLTIKIWNVDTGKCIRTLSGHTAGIRALQFDNQKLISGSLDQTVRIWNWRTGECINAYQAHTAGVIALNFVDNILASGSMDTTVKVWNFEDKSVFVLQGHSDWVNAVRVDADSRTLFSASDDRTVRLWDLDTRQTIQVFEGHVGFVQQVVLLPAGHEFDDIIAANDNDHCNGTCSDMTHEINSHPSTPQTNWHESWPTKRPKPPRYILTGALDSTVRLWDVVSGECLQTLFGHVEGIWAVAGDTLRVVTGAEDKMVKVWDLRTGKCEKTFLGHTGPVTCVGLSDSRMCSGSEDCEVRLYSFKQEEVLAENLSTENNLSIVTQIS